MAELRERANHLQQKNEHLRTRLETDGVENPQGAAQPVSLTHADKSKEPALPDHSDLVDDEFSSDNSILPRLSPPQNNAEAESRKRPPRQPSRAISGERRRMQREASWDKPHSELAPEQISTRFEGMAPQFLPRMQHFIPLSEDHTTCCLPP